MNGDDLILFRRGATRLIALHGGWNERSRSAVLWLASRHRIPPSEVAGVLASAEYGVLSAPKQRGWVSDASLDRVPQVRPKSALWVEQSGSGDPILKVVLAISLVSLALSLGAAVIVLPGVLGRDAAPTQPAIQGDRGESGSPAPTTEPAVAPAPAAEEPGQQEPEPSSINLQQPPQAVLAQFERVFTSTALRWPEMPEATRRAAKIRMVDALTMLLNDSATAERAIELMERAVEPIVIESLGDQGAAGIDGPTITTAVWAADLLCGLDTRRRLPAWVSHRLSSILWPLSSSSSSGNAGSCDAASGAMRAAAKAIRTPENAPGALAEARRASEAWSRWLASAMALSGSDQALRSALLLSGLSVLMYEAPEPAASLTTSEAMRRLVASLGWREGSAERAWLLRVLVDPALSADDLFTLTAALAATSSAPGVDMTMVLPREAGETERRALAVRYADAWSMASTMHIGSFVPTWSAAARDVLSQHPYEVVDNEMSVDKLRHAVRISALIASATAAMRGDEDTADRFLIEGRNQLVPLTDIITDTNRYSPTTGASSGVWGLEFLRSDRDQNRRLDLLASFPRSADLVDAKILVEAIFKDTSAAVRRAAFDALRENDHQPSVVHAVLDSLPRLPRSAMASAVVAEVGHTPQISVSDPNWRLRLRIVLVERLYEMIGAEAAGPLIDRAAEQLAASYAVRADRPAPRDRADPMIEYVPLIEQWRERLASLPGVDASAQLRSIDERLTRRLGLASGSMQRLVAYQRAVAELTARVVSYEQPAHAKEIAELLTTTEAAVDSSNHVFAQISELEILCLRLWLMRLEGEL